MRSRCTIPVLLGALTALPARAQIVNVQAKFSDAPQPGLSGVAEASADWRTGNTEVLVLKAGLTGVYYHAPHLLLAMAKAEYGTTGDTPFLSRTFEHVRYRVEALEWVAGEVFVQHEYDAFRRLQLRALLGVGVRLQILDEKEAGLALGIAVMVEHEEITDGGPPATDPRASTYALGRLRLAERVVLTETLYYQPKLTGFTDLRLLNQSALVVEATKSFSISFGLNLSWDTAPPEGVEPLDTQLKTALAFRF